MAEFLDSTKWVEFVEWVQKQMQEKENLAGGSNNEQTKNEERGT